MCTHVYGMYFVAVLILLLLFVAFLTMFEA